MHFWPAVRPPSILFPGHALHEKGLQRQIGVGTLVSSQERRALAVPLINRGSTADFVPPSVYIGLRLFVLPKRHPGQCLRFAGGQETGLSPGRIGPTASSPTQPRPPSPPRRAPPRPDPTVVCLGFRLVKNCLCVAWWYEYCWCAGLPSSPTLPCPRRDPRPRQSALCQGFGHYKNWSQ